MFTVLPFESYGGCNNRWNHCGGCSVLSSGVQCEYLDIPFIQTSEESVYTRKVGELIDSLGEALYEELVYSHFWVYWFPEEQLWFIASHNFWWKDLGLERRARLRTSKEFVGWGNVESFGVPTLTRDKVYVSIYEVWRKLWSVLPSKYSVSSSLVVFIEPNIVRSLRACARRLEGRWKWACVGRSHVVSFGLSRGRLEASLLGSAYPSIHQGRLSVIVTPPSAVRQLIHDYEFPKIVHGTSFHVTRAWIAYCRTIEIYWESHGVNDVFLL